MFTETMHQFLTLYRYLRSYARQMHGEGLSGRKISTLRYLLEAGPCAIGQLGDYLYINYSSTSELVDRLEQAGYVTRTRSDVDNRVVIVTLTPAGRAAAEGTPLGGIPLLRERLKALPPERLSRIKEVLDEIVQLLEISDAP
jgi:DNA-binding MarR family transcriptional regulator